MKKLITLTLLGCGTLSFAMNQSNVHAHQTQTWSKLPRQQQQQSSSNDYFNNLGSDQGLYLGFDIGQAYEKVNLTDTSTGQTAKFSTHDAGVSAIIGYQMSKYGAIEVNFTALPTIQSIDFVNTGITLKGMIPFSDHFSLYGKIGLATITADQSDDYYGTDQSTECGAMAGAGIDIGLTRQTRLLLGVDTMSTSDYKGVYGHVGINYIFS